MNPVKARTMKMLWKIDFYNEDRKGHTTFLAQTRQQARWLVVCFKKENPTFKQVRLSRL